MPEVPWHPRLSLAAQQIALQQKRRDPFLKGCFGEAAEATLEHAAVGSDEDRVRQRPTVVAESLRAVRPDAGFVDQDRIRDRMFGEETLHRSTIVDRDADHLQAAIRMALLDAIEQRHFLAARPAPARPEIEQDELAVPFGEVART